MEDDVYQHIMKTGVAFLLGGGRGQSRATLECSLKGCVLETVSCTISAKGVSNEQE